MKIKVDHNRKFGFITGFKVAISMQSCKESVTWVNENCEFSWNIAQLSKQDPHLYMIFESEIDAVMFKLSMESGVFV